MLPMNKDSRGTICGILEPEYLQLCLSYKLPNSSRRNILGLKANTEGKGWAFCAFPMVGIQKGGGFRGSGKCLGRNASTPANVPQGRIFCGYKVCSRGISTSTPTLWFCGGRQTCLPFKIKARRLQGQLPSKGVKAAFFST